MNTVWYLVDTVGLWSTKEDARNERPDGGGWRSLQSADGAVPQRAQQGLMCRLSVSQLESAQLHLNYISCISIEFSAVSET